MCSTSLYCGVNVTGKLLDLVLVASILYYIYVLSMKVDRMYRKNTATAER